MIRMLRNIIIAISIIIQQTLIKTTIQVCTYHNFQFFYSNTQIRNCMYSSWISIFSPHRSCHFRSIHYFITKFSLMLDSITCVMQCSKSPISFIYYQITCIHQYITTILSNTFSSYFFFISLIPYQMSLMLQHFHYYFHLHLIGSPSFFLFLL